MDQMTRRILDHYIFFHIPKNDPPIFRHDWKPLLMKNLPKVSGIFQQVRLVVTHQNELAHLFIPTPIHSTVFEGSSEHREGKRFFLRLLSVLIIKGHLNVFHRFYFPDSFTAFSPIPRDLNSPRPMGDSYFMMYVTLFTVSKGHVKCYGAIPYLFHSDTFQPGYDE